MNERHQEGPKWGGIKVTLLLVVLTVGFSPCIHAQDSATLTLKETVQIALQRHPDVEKARAAADVLKGRIREVRAQAFPEVNFTSNVLRWRDPSLLNASGLDKFPAELRDAL